MLFPQTLKIYNVYALEGDRKLERVLFVREGFTIYAFLFHMFWALYNRLWLVALMVFTFYGLLYQATEFDIISYGESVVIELGFLAWLGFNGQDWVGAGLQKRGYVLIDIVSATSEPLAVQRFYDRLLPSAAGA
ncbi:MAG: DUF2628 domain-containing protein [Proteobacteria bacterium]|nr:DUF2628 domain-containing protein [Pseudomonadota bacterium]